MSESLDLQKAERRAFNLTFQDGLLDLALGLGLLALVLAPLLERAVPLADWWLVLLALPILAALAAGKRWITTPRLGRVRFLPARKLRVRAVAAIVGLILLGGLLAGIAWLWLGQGSFPGWTKELLLPSVLWAAVFLLIFSLSAYTLDLPRLYLYGVPYALVYPAQLLSRTVPGLGMPILVLSLVSAAAMCAVGAFLLARFLRTYPPLVGEDLYGNS